MAVPEALLADHARRAYEWGRFRAALPTAGLVIPMATVSMWACGGYAAPAVCGSALALLITASLWRGEEFGRGVRAGLWGGLAPLLLPVAVGASGHTCQGGVCLLMPLVCVGGRVLGGLAV